MDVRALTLAALLLGLGCGSEPARSGPPRRLVMVFVDTLRPDHMGTYGYARETTPGLDAWAQQAAVFTSARSVAPWTLPSARSALSGRQPEGWADGPVLMERLSDAGWATGAVISNVFLSEPEDIGQGIADFRYTLLSPAADQVAQALDFLSAHADEDAAVLVHFIDPHLPYTEPEAYRTRWASPEPPLELRDKFLRGDVLGGMPAPDSPDFAASRQYMVDRYDQNVRYVDDALAPLWAALGPEDVVVFFSDHGEEFWEHGGFEHGHALYDEVVRVPLMIRAPGVAPARIDAPASLLDVTPTVLGLLGLPAEGLDGRDLFSGGEAAAPLAIGRPLYGRDQWAVVEGTTKWLRGPEQTVRFDLAADPGEAQPQAADAGAMRERLAAAGVGEVVPVWRLSFSGEDKNAYFPGAVTVERPGGFQATWGAHDPHAQLTDPVLGAGGERVSVALVTDSLFPGEVYLQPAAGGGAATLRLQPKDGEEIVISGALPLEGAVGPHGVRLVEDVAVVPRPGAERGGLGAELAEGLRALGYLE